MYVGGAQHLDVGVVGKQSIPPGRGPEGRAQIRRGLPAGGDVVASRTFDGRLQLLEYRPTVLTGPPGTTERPTTSAPS